ncbi:MAG TPA: hypothetical protein VGQ36_05855 [Thermoanaerobaculia bacterium]|jgi:hypothetical protein|nr:hypothetical protein [Thermoanaerobaculia bacterium]
MTQPGGAATHYGILYQALGTIDASFTISSRGDIDDPDTVTLTIEPRGGGGDAIAASAQRRTVMQFKARGDYRTWSLNEIIDDVLRDLYRAVPNEPSPPSEYLLITEGREGDIKEARRFFRELSGDFVPDDPLAVLDDGTQRRYFPSGERITDRAFFDQIARLVTAEAPPSLDAYRRVWSLLSRFNIRSEEKFDDLAQRVEQRLLGYVDAPEDVTGKARELFGLLLQLAGNGPQTFTLPALLRRVDLPAMSLADLPATRDVASERLATNLKRLGHDPSQVVRRTASLTDRDSIFCLAGDSGSGKTTLAGQVASDLAADAIVVFVSTRDGIDTALQHAADEVWKRLLGHGRPIDWESLIRQSKLVGLADRRRWLTVCLDITAGTAEAQQLLRLEWAEWNVRLLFTADATAGKKISENALSLRCTIQTVEELSVNETYEFLKKRGRSIAQVPHDVVSLLRRPILADVYCRVTQDADWKPANEYELFDAFWKDVVDGHDGTRHRQALGILLRLGETLLDGTELYPWPQDVLHRIAVSDDAQQHLIGHGWLRELESTDIEFAHERFANWSIARTMYERTARGRWNVDELSSRLAAIHVEERTPGKLFLGYVPMDVLWLLAENNAATDVIVAVIKAVDGADDHDRGLYETLLPSIGPAIVPALHQMMREEGREWHSRHTVSQCVISIASKAVIPEPVVVGLLESEIEQIHDTGLSVARTQPQVGSLDRLWRLQRQANAVSEKDTQSHWRSERALRALMAAVRKNPEWIRTATQTTDSLEELRTLAWMVSMLGDERGAALWHDVKSVFLARFGGQGARGALQCIDRYDDTAEIDRLAGWVITGDNFVPAEALAALAAIDGARVFTMIENDPLDRVETLASFWLPPLLLQDTARTHEAIRKRFEISEVSPASLRWDFRGENQIDPPIIAAVVKRLDRLISDQLSVPKPNRPPGEVDHLLGVLGSVNSLAGLRALREEANAPFADSLVKLAAQYTPHDANTLDRFFIRAIQQVLLRIGGDALSNFVLLQLKNPGDWARSDIRSSATSPSTEARELLIGLADTTSANNHAEDALFAIAALGEREVVVSLLETNKDLWIGQELLQLLQASAPIDDVQLSRLLSRDASGPAERVRRFNLLSLSARSDVVERLIEEVATETNDDVKSAAFHAIRHLTSATTPVVAALKIGLSQEPEEVASVLRAIGTEEALDVLESHLEKLDLARISDDLVWIAAWLVTAKKRHGLARLVWQFVESPRRRLFVPTTRLYDAVGYFQESTVLDFLHQEAFSADADDRVGAIRGLSHHRPGAAFDAASAALASSEANRGSYADLLIEIDPSRGVDVLCQRLIIERITLARAYICRALRRVQSDLVLSGRVQAMLASSDAYERAAGCQVAGWLDDFEDACLRRLALREPDAMVRAFALGGLRMHLHNRRVTELLGELRGASGSYAWGLLQAVLDSATPLLLTFRDDSLWLGGALSGKPRAMILYAQQRVDEQIKEMSRKSEDAFDPYYR